MSGSCGVCVDGVLYLFGGHHARGNTNRVQFGCCIKHISQHLLLFSHGCIMFKCKTVRWVSLPFVIIFHNSCILCCALQIYRLPLRAPTLVWEEMRDLKGLPPSCKDKLGCWVQKNRWGVTRFFLLFFFLQTQWWNVLLPQLVINVKHLANSRTC